MGLPEIQTQTHIGDTDWQSEIRQIQNLMNDFDHTCDAMSIVLLWGRPLELNTPVADYYDNFAFAKSFNINFQRILDASDKIKALSSITAPHSSLTHATLKESLRPTDSYADLVQTILRPRYTSPLIQLAEEHIPYAALELLLYMNILQGAHPEQYIHDFSKNITTAMNNNPQTTWETMVATGIDLALPDFPKLPIEMCDQIALSLETWNTEGYLNTNGVDFFIRTLEQHDVITRLEGETTQERWNRITQLLPKLQRFIPAEQTDHGYQSPEYYMQLILALQHFGLHRRTQFKKDNETISALLVRRSDGKILSYAINEPIPGTGKYKHAEELVTEQARITLGNPDEQFEDCDLYISCTPCATQCAPLLRTLKLHGLYTGPHTTDEPDEGIEDLASEVHTNLYNDEFTHLFEERLHWLEFIKKISR